MPPKTPRASEPRARAATRPSKARSGRRRSSRRRLPASERVHVAILSRKKTLYSTRRMVEAGRALGHEVSVLDTLRCHLLVEKGRPRIVYEGREITGVDVVIPRIGASITQYGLSVVTQFSLMGVAVLNDALPIARARDKLRSLQLLAQADIDVPRTVMMREHGDLDLAVEQVGGLPAIVKLISGTQGVGVMIAHTQAELDSILETMRTLGQEILLQEFIAESKGKDVRAFVVGDRVIGAMRRVAKVKGEFRSNIHRGGEGEPLTLTGPYAETAVRAARVLGLEVAGVDMLESSVGPKIMEVNSSPGFEGLERATGLDIATELLSHAVAVARARSGRVAPQEIR